MQVYSMDKVFSGHSEFRQAIWVRHLMRRLWGRTHGELIYWVDGLINLDSADENQ